MKQVAFLIFLSFFCLFVFSHVFPLFVMVFVFLLKVLEKLQLLPHWMVSTFGAVYLKELLHPEQRFYTTLMNRLELQFVMAT